MLRRYAEVAMITAIALCFLSGGIFAAELPDVITMQSDQYDHHKMGIVHFSHKKHSEEYAAKAPDLYKDGCGACHHDADHKPLRDLTADDKVQKCIECHKKPGIVPKEVKKEWRAKKIKRKEKAELALAWHAEAIHANCKGCHKAYNRKFKTKAAPTTCGKCHPKTKKSR